MYIKTKTLEQRLKESSEILQKYPNKIPIIIEKNNMDTNLSNLDRNKFLVPDDLTFGQIIHIIRKRLDLNPTIGIYLYCNNNLITTTSNIRSVYKDYHNEDKFLYITYSGENTFG